MAKQAKLPTPATSGEMFLAAAVEELRRLNDNIEGLLDAISEPVDAPTEEVQLKEPDKPKPTTRDDKQAADRAAEKPKKS